MATTERGSPLGLGKDRKPTRSLSRISTAPSLIPTLSKRSPKDTTSSIVSINKARSVPSHIKPPLSSPSSPTSKLIKKHSPKDSSPKVVTNRRRSFDKPHPIVTKKQPSKAHPKSNVPIRRSMTAPASKKAGTKSRIEAVEPTLILPCMEAEFGDGYALPDEFEEIANIGSDEDLVPFDGMELPAYTCSVNVAKSDPIKEEMKDDKVQQQVEASNQQGENHSTGTSQDFEKMDSTRDFEGGDGLEGREAQRQKWKQQQQKGDKDKGKRDSPVYNDVIEETASKLLEKRKNKVRALVGAFETVISLQD